MKKINLFCLVCLLSLLYSCQNSELETIEDSKFGSIEKRQDYWTNFQKIEPCEAANLTYYISPDCIGTEYENVIDDAFEAYNDVGSALNFTQTSDPNTASIVMDCVDSGGTCGNGASSVPWDNPDGPPGNPNEVTTLPSGGTIGGLIHLHINWETCPCTEDVGGLCEYEETDLSCVLQRTVMHEVGHAIGMAHNNQEGSFGNPTNILGTPDVYYDEGSVFNSGDATAVNCAWCTSPCEFNENDIFAIQFLYEGCEFPSSPPLEMEYICIGDQICYDFAGFECEITNVTANSTKLIIDHTDTEICVEYIKSNTDEIIVTIEVCGGADVQWTINVNDDGHCSGGDGGFPFPK